MRFHEVNLPQVVIDAQKRGTFVLFAGAGVSMDAPSSYPNFLNLATELGGTASPIEEHELIDRYLGRLVEKGIPVHERVKTRLSDPTSRPNHLHETIVRLFGSADNIRIVTTNFDDHFRGAAQTVYGAAPEIYRAPALPLGDDFNGIVHLHGSVLDDAKRLVLTDADFGRAYLTQAGHGASFSNCSRDSSFCSLVTATKTFRCSTLHEVFLQPRMARGDTRSRLRKTIPFG